MINDIFAISLKNFIVLHQTTATPIEHFKGIQPSPKLNTNQQHKSQANRKSHLNSSFPCPKLDIACHQHRLLEFILPMPKTGFVLQLMLMGLYFMASLKPKLIGEHAALPPSSSSSHMIYQRYHPDAWSQLYSEPSNN